MSQRTNFDQCKKLKSAISAKRFNPIFKGVGIGAHSSDASQYCVAVLYDKDATTEQIDELRKIVLAIENPDNVEIIFEPRGQAFAY